LSRITQIKKHLVLLILLTITFILKVFRENVSLSSQRKLPLVV